MSAPASDDALVIQWAFFYADQGFSVIPTALGEKRPGLATWEEWQKRRPDKTQLSLWFTGGLYRNCGIGLVTGAVSGNVFGVDPDAGQGKQGLENLDDVLMMHDDFPETWQSKTGGGGKHYFFRAPPGVRIRTGKNVVAQDVDVRGEGGFLVLPPSTHPCGRAYEWIEGVDPATTNIADAPDWLIDICRDDTPGASAGGAPPPGGDFDPFGRRIDGREEYMRDLLWARLIEARRNCPLPLTQSVLDEILRETWAVFERKCKARSEGGLAADGRGINEMRRKLKYAAKKWDTRIATEAAKPRPAGAWEDTARGWGEGPQQASSAPPPSSWSEPQPLPEGLLPVAQFSTDFLPFTLSNWVDDIAERMQCPPEFVAVTAVAALGAVLGRRIGVRPEQHTDWVEVCSFWACVVGRPGWLKSPAMNEAMKPLMRLEAEAQKENEKARKTYEQELELWNLKKKLREKAANDALKRDGNARVDFGDGKPEEPQAKRYITSDSTYEALGAILVNNPNGVLVFRDELVSLLKTLDREEYSAARGFYLSAWSGKQPYTFDRIIRGHQHIEAAFAALVGSSQPGRIAEYLRRARSTGDGNDGLIQRFSLFVWPDVSPHWRNTDAYPNTKAREVAWEVFQRFSEITALAVKAEHDSFDALPYLRFDGAAQVLFNDWRDGFEKHLRSGELSEAMEGHLAKYRKLVPTLALLNHLADGEEGSIRYDALRRALAFAAYLETHAKRAYAAVTGTDADAARRILDHIRNGDLKDGFKARDIHQHGWAGLTDRERVGKGLELLVDFDWIAPQAVGKNPAGGRPTTIYNINPRVWS